MLLRGRAGRTLWPANLSGLCWPGAFAMYSERQAVGLGGPLGYRICVLAGNPFLENLTNSVFSNLLRLWDFVLSFKAVVPNLFIMRKYMQDFRSET